jgi:hypothetical protein
MPAPDTSRGNGESRADRRPNGHGAGAFVRTLDDLALLSHHELRDLFASSSVPSSLSALDGDLRGRMLAPAGLRQGRLFRALARVARSPRFPWLGKTFASEGESEGRGKNRLRLLGTHRIAPFTTRFGTSAVDGKPCVVLRYRGLPIHDELREVGPGLFFGPACLKRAFGKPVVAVWFAVDGTAEGGTSPR